MDDLDITAKPADVLAWAEGFPARADEALQAELARGKPRQTLVADLRELADPPIGGTAV